MFLGDLIVLFFVEMVFVRATNNAMMVMEVQEMDAQTVRKKVDLIASKISTVDLFVLRRLLLIAEMESMSQITMSNVMTETA